MNRAKLKLTDSVQVKGYQTTTLKGIMPIDLAIAGSMVSFVYALTYRTIIMHATGTMPHDPTHRSHEKAPANCRQAHPHLFD